MKKMSGPEVILRLCAIVYFFLLIAIGLTSCVNIEPITVSENGNFTCDLPDKYADKGLSVDGTLTINGMALARDGTSVLSGKWRLCNDDSGVTCTVTIIPKVDSGTVGNAEPPSDPDPGLVIERVCPDPPGHCP